MLGKPRKMGPLTYVALSKRRGSKGGRTFMQSLIGFNIEEPSQDSSSYSLWMSTMMDEWCLFMDEIYPWMKN